MSRTQDGGITLPDAGLADMLTQVQTALLDAAALDAAIKSIDIAGSGNITPAQSDLRGAIVKLTGALTGNRTVLWPTTECARRLIIWNATSGAYTVTVKTTASGSTGIVVEQGTARHLFRDSANVNAAGPAIIPSSGVVASQPPAKSVRVYRNTDQSIPDSTATLINFDAENHDTDNFHDISTNNSRLTVPVAGKYAVWVCVRWASNSTGYRDAQLKKTGAQAQVGARAPAVNGDDTIISMMTVLDLAANDYVEVEVYQTRGGALNVVSGAAATTFGAAFLGV